MADLSVDHLSVAKAFWQNCVTEHRETHRPHPATYLSDGVGL